MTRKPILTIVAATVIAAVVALVAIPALSACSQGNSQRGDANYRRELQNVHTIEYNGATYRPKTNLTTILLMGVDHASTAEEGLINRSGGQADFLRLVAIDPTNKKVYQIALDRDTMTPITILGVLGNRAGSRVERLSLSHAFGDGEHESCKLTVEAVSNLLYDTTINYYLALDMDGISELNDWLGGVTVTLEDDFSHIDPAMVAGETITLQGDQAEIFVRERMSIGVGTNESRMARQQLYLDEAQRLLRERIAQDENASDNLFDTINFALCTNLSKGTLANVFSTAKDCETEPVITPTGTHEFDAEGFMQFFVDEDSLMDAIIRVFYEQVG